MVLRKPIPDNLINPDDFASTKNVINAIARLFIFVGIGTMVVGLATMIAGWDIPNPNFNFKF